MGLIPLKASRMSLVKTAQPPKVISKWLMTTRRILKKYVYFMRNLRPKVIWNKFTLLKGNASETLSELLVQRPELVVSLVIFDMDIYKSTKDVLELLKPRLHKGSILVFDEFNCPHFPGETVAVMEGLDFKDFEFIQSPYLPFNSVCKFGN